MGDGRCFWVPVEDDLYREYHDREWGRPVGEETALFERISLEAFQSGLSWRTILAKRDNFRHGFAGFDPDRVARFGESDVARLMADAGIVRNRRKIEATIGNARALLRWQDSRGPLGSYLWSMAAVGEPAPSQEEAMSRTTSPASMEVSRELKRAGWGFVGPTTVYAMMQAVGIVDDHTAGCLVRVEVEAERSAFLGNDDLS